MNDIADLAKQTLLLVLILSAPALAVSLAVGLMIGLLQAVTQIQDQALSFVPKMIAVGFVLLVIGSWAGSELMTFSTELWRSLRYVTS